jgi:protein TonB
MKQLLSFLIFISCFYVAQAQSEKDSAGSMRINGQVISRVEVEASFPGGDEGWKNFLVKNLKIDNAEDAVPRHSKKFSQTAIVRFIVRPDGSLDSIGIENKVHPSIEKEALRVIRKSPKWIPAMVNGKAVSAYRRQPISFYFESI